MNATQFTYLLNNPSTVNGLHSNFLEKAIQEFPYFQSARALQLKNLFSQESFHYNQELRKTAAYTADRSVLFEFISSDNFVSIQKTFHDQKQAALKEIIVNQSQEVFINESKEVVFVRKDNEIVTEEVPEKITSKLEQSIIDSISTAIFNEKEEISAKIIDKLEIGKPLSFDEKEKHSFQEWLQMAHFKPIDRSVTLKNSFEKPILEDESKKRKQEIIDKFIETNPKITPIKNYTTPIIIDKTVEDNSHIMTETLAKVYLEQKKYQKAIQAYEILILKYPEKFSFFANRISDIKNLQQNNN